MIPVQRLEGQERRGKSLGGKSSSDSDESEVAPRNSFDSITETVGEILTPSMTTASPHFSMP